MKPARVCSGLRKSARTVSEVIQEVWQLLLQSVPLKTLVLGPGCRVISESLLQVPGYDMSTTPEPLYIPAYEELSFGVTLKETFFLKYKVRMKFKLGLKMRLTE